MPENWKGGVLRAIAGADGGAPAAAVYDGAADMRLVYNGGRLVPAGLMAALPALWKRSRLRSHWRAMSRLQPFITKNRIRHVIWTTSQMSAAKAISRRHFPRRLASAGITAVWPCAHSEDNP